MSASQGKKSSGKKGLAQFLHLTQNSPASEGLPDRVPESQFPWRSLDEMWKKVPAGYRKAEWKRPVSSSEEGKSKNSGNDLLRDGGGIGPGNVPSTSESSSWMTKRETPQKNGIVKTVSFAETNTIDLEAAKREARKVAVASNSVIEVEAEHKLKPKPKKLDDSQERATPREENVAKKVNAEVKSRPEKPFGPPRRIPMGMQNVDRDYLELLQTFATNLNDPLTESWED